MNERIIINTVCIVVWIIMYFIGMKVLRKATQQWRRFLGHSDWDK